MALRKRLIGIVGVGLLAAACSTPGRDDRADEHASRMVTGFDLVLETQGTVSDLTSFEVEGSNVRVVTWKETLDGVTLPYYAINLGSGWSEPKKTSYDVPLRSRRLDPQVEVQSTELRGKSQLHIVQFVTQPLEAYWNVIEAAGGKVHHYLHGNAQVFRGGPKVVERIAKTPFVRAMIPMNPRDKVEPALKALGSETISVSVVLVDPENDRSLVEDFVRSVGGKLVVTGSGILIDVEIPANALDALAEVDQVLWLERNLPMEEDYDLTREFGGADHLEALSSLVASGIPDYTGVGIRGHIMEGITPTHGDFAANDFRSAPIGIDNTSADSHGQQTFGIVFGSGAGNARARGLLPNGQGYFTHNRAFSGSSAGVGTRSDLVGKLMGEHKVMFQTASWGHPQVTTYGARSAELDALILKHDIPITQSQSNTGTQRSRPQAWAKNVISVGGIRHFGTLTTDDDKWNRSGSIGPAADGSIKPDLAAYNDKIITTTATAYSTSFGGTSGATPIVAGHVGLTIELWTNGVFGNPLIPRAAGEDIASFRFKNRPHFTTTKALLIHTAKQYKFEGENHDLTRTHQGWGFPDLKEMHTRGRSMIVVDETDVLRNLERRTYTLDVRAGAPDFKATLVYADKEAAVPATIHRVNNLDLKVTAPDGTVYWGNNGLKAGMTSTPGGEHNVLDTVENVIVANPRAGTWKVEVIADEINADTHLETPGVDADYALVVSSGAN